MPFDVDLDEPDVIQLVFIKRADPDFLFVNITGGPERILRFNRASS